MRIVLFKICFCFLVLVLLLLGSGPQALAREVVDMLGRTVTIPDNPARVFASTAHGYNLMYSLAPELLCGRTYPFRSQMEKDMTRPELRDLPMIGSVGSESEHANLEVLLALKPDLLIVVVPAAKEDLDAPSHQLAQKDLARTGLPYVVAYAKDLRDYPAVYKFLGEVLNRRERAGLLAGYISDALADAERVMAQVPAAQRPKVYYAEGLDGMSTEPNNMHTVLLQLAGDVNVHKNAQSTVSGMGLEKVSMERIMAYRPDYILAFEKTFYDNVYQSPVWRNVKAVQEKQVLWIPRGPFNWFDRPSSFMGALGLKWLLANLYPEQYPLDIIAEAIGFYSLFLDYELTPEQMQRLIYP